MKGTERFTAYIYYLITVLFLFIIGIRAFSTLASKPLVIVILGFLFPFIIVSLIRWRFEPLLVLQVHYFDQVKRQLVFDFSLFAIAALMLFYFVFFTLEQSFFTSFKIFFGAITIGYFAGLDGALSRQRTLIKDVRPIYKDEFTLNSFAGRMKLMLTTTIILTLVVITLSAIDALRVFDIYKDLSAEQEKVFFFLEIFFIFAIVVSFSIRLIHSYTLNVKLLFQSQIDVLKNIQSRNFSEYAPVVCNDEFGLVAQQINRVIDELNEKERIRKTLEHIVSPNIMEKLLSNEEGDLKAGQEYDVAILFCDLRKFTTYAESTPPEEVIFFLNAFFSKVADIVEANNGIINKFMGDAILAVFGTTNEENPVEDAINAVWDIMLHTQSNKINSGKMIDIGIGIHSGKALAGIIGSNDRYEYTFVGDVVNTANRLDGLTKRLGYKVIISVDAFKQLSHDQKERFTDLGRHKIRGKQEKVHVYGAFSVNE